MLRLRVLPFLKTTNNAHRNEITSISSNDSSEDNSVHDELELGYED